MKRRRCRPSFSCCDLLSFNPVWGWLAFHVLATTRFHRKMTARCFVVLGSGLFVSRKSIASSLSATLESNLFFARVTGFGRLDGSCVRKLCGGKTGRAVSSACRTCYLNVLEGATSQAQGHILHKRLEGQSVGSVPHKALLLGCL